MFSINSVRNVNGALATTLWEIRTNSNRVQSRNGLVARVNNPVVTITTQPRERVLFCAERNANHFFHLVEALWMLAGSNQLAFLAQFNSNMVNYSDDGGATQPAAYGHRWRYHLGSDQLHWLVNLLQRDPTTRRAVITMWDPRVDMTAVTAGGRDVPCNTQCYFSVRDGKLNMTVFCRSNDAIWGAHGANAVHFSVLLEFVALACKLEVGEMTQYSHDMHVYANDRWPEPERLVFDWAPDNRYTESGVTYEPLLLPNEAWQDFLTDSEDMAYCGKVEGFRTLFFRHTVAPLLHAWYAYKTGGYSEALETVETVVAEDWRIACTEWLQRAIENKKTRS